MNDRERLNALEMALHNEMDEREFYLKHAQRTTNPVGKVMFARIADEELEHYQRLKELYAAWKKTEKWPETVPLTVKRVNIKSIIKDTINQIDEAAQSSDDDLKAIEIASDFEARGSEVYAELRDAVEDPKEKAFFDLLSRIEREHYLSLKDAEQYLKDPESWFAGKERHGLDGA